MTERLTVLLNERNIGVIDRENSRLTFTYASDWREDPDAYPLSLSLPLGAAKHGHSKVEAYLWGLLPDNDRVLEAWAKQFQVSPRNAFRLIEHVGADCAGAVQFVRPERLTTLQDGSSESRISWLTRTEVAERLRMLRQDPSAGRIPRDKGQFSLAGAQPKTALHLKDNRWGVPSGRVPTTHILKPPTGEWEGHAENEHFCLRLARSMGLAVPNSSVERFEEEIAIVIQRFDRIRLDGRWSRVHQEDLCQAIGCHPEHKYESDGGPGIVAVVNLLREHSSSPADDLRSFLDGIAYNWLIASTDAHAKNYALLHGKGCSLRLAPLYDLASILPHKSIDILKAKLAMKLGGEYLLRNIGLRHWQRLAKLTRVDEGSLIDRVTDLTNLLPDQIEALKTSSIKEGLSRPIITTLASALQDRIVACKRQIGS